MPSAKRRQAYVMFAAGGLAITGILASTLVLSHREKAGIDGCLNGFARSTVILLDRSDLVAVQTQDEIVRRIQSIVANEVHPGEMVSVFTIDDLTRKEFKPRFSRCMPRSTGNELTENPKALAAHKVRDFDVPLKKAILENFEGSKESRIAEALVDLSRTQYLRAPGGARLLIYSDLIQNTPNLSLYRCGSGAQAIEAFRSEQVSGVQRPQFKNVRVVLNSIPGRKLSAQNVRCRGEFWNWFFGDDTGTDAGVDFDPLPGPA